MDTKILEELEPGTILYTQYVEDIVDVLKNALQSKEFRVAQFTGKDKSGLDEFLNMTDRFSADNVIKYLMIRIIFISWTISIYFYCYYFFVA